MGTKKKPKIAEGPGPPAMTAAAAAAAAEAEGLTLLVSDNVTGFRGVSRYRSGKTPFVAFYHSTYLGSFATAEEAALTVARATPGTMTAEDAKAAAEREGLTLARSDKNATGYSGVRVGSSSIKPFWASAYVDKRKRYLGSFKTAEEAALVVARAGAGKE